VHLVAVDLEDHEVVTLVERLCGVLPADVASPQFSGASRDEVMDALLRLQPLVKVLVAGKHDVDAIFQEQGLQLIAQRRIRAVPAAGRVDGMMEVRDLPV
jgi:hypothetical protein